VRPPLRRYREYYHDEISHYLNEGNRFRLTLSIGHARLPPCQKTLNAVDTFRVNTFYPWYTILGIKCTNLVSLETWKHWIYGLGILLDEDMRSGAEEIKCTITVTRHKISHSIDCELSAFPLWAKTKDQPLSDTKEKDREGVMTTLKLISKWCARRLRGPLDREGRFEAVL